MVIVLKSFKLATLKQKRFLTVQLTLFYGSPAEATLYTLALSGSFKLDNAVVTYKKSRSKAGFNNICI